MSDDTTAARCEGCGATRGVEEHKEQCPATQVRVVDKRGTNKPEDEGARLAREAQEALQNGEAMPLEPLARLEPSERQERIEELRALGAEGPLTPEDAAELLKLQVEEEEDAPQPGARTQLMTAFLVLIGHDGSVTATSDVNLEMELDRVANVDDMDAGCAIVRRDIQASMTAKQVVFGMQVSAQAIQQQAQQQAVMQRLQGGMAGRRRG